MPRRKRKKPQRLSHLKYDSSSTSYSSLKVDNDKRQCVNLNGDQRKVDISSENKSNMSNNSTMNSSNSLQYTPLTSTPGLNYQHFQQFRSRPPPFPPQALMTGIEPMLKDLCQKMSNIENKLTKIDNIETRLNSME